MILEFTFHQNSCFYGCRCQLVTRYALVHTKISLSHVSDCQNAVIREPVAGVMVGLDSHMTSVVQLAIVAVPLKPWGRESVAGTA